MSIKQGFEFLRKLEKNNNRPWFTEHKSEFDEILKENKIFFQDIFDNLREHDKVDKLHIYRIYKDVRFSKDKTPYKLNFGASISRVKPMLRGGYYVHLEPNKSFVGGGFYAPNSEDLFRIRKEFELDIDEIKNIVSEPLFQKYFGEIKGKDAVKIAPKGFDKNHPAIDLIKKKQFVVMREFTDEQVFSNNFSEEIIKTFLAMRPWFDYMSDVLTTDLNGESLL